MLTFWKDQLASMYVTSADRVIAAHLIAFRIDATIGLGQKHWKDQLASMYVTSADRAIVAHLIAFRIDATIGFGQKRVTRHTVRICLLPRPRPTQSTDL
jgi:hypothetical protein